MGAALLINSRAVIGHNDGPEWDDWADPNTWAPPPAPDEPRFISLSDRIDCCVILDYQDWLWARELLWCHTFGSGKRDHWFKSQKSPEKIYARRSVREPGWTDSGRARYGNQWLHREICRRKEGEPPSPEHVCDHLDGDSLNCRRENLTWATLSENAKNKFGVAWLQLRMPWT